MKQVLAFYRYAMKEINHISTFHIACAGIVAFAVGIYLGLTWIDVPHPHKPKAQTIKTIASATPSNTRIIPNVFNTPKPIQLDKSKSIDYLIPKRVAKALEVPITKPTPTTPPVFQMTEFDEGQYVEDVAEPIAEAKIEEEITPTKPTTPTIKRGKLAIMIDDVGMSPFVTAKLLKLPTAITLSFLPYAPDVANQVKKAKRAGFDIWLHMPMEPLDQNIDPGPHALKVAYDLPTLKREIEWQLSQFDGFIGANNHMGSLLTQSSGAMDAVMQMLKKRNIAFVDSKTTPLSKAAKFAAKHQLSFRTRDVFLDHVDSEAYVLKQLKRAEKLTLKQDYVLAIAHPRKATIRALKKWFASQNHQQQLTRISNTLRHDEPILLSSKL